MSSTREPGGVGGGDLLVRNVGQLLTLRGPARPRRGVEHRELGLVRDGAVLVESGRIAAVGRENDVRAGVRSVDVLDARGGVVLPGFVDAHTHALFAGSRASELADKLAGRTYAEIAREGGGIRRTVRDTRAATREELHGQTRARLLRMVAHGTTTVEVKSGYGLDLAQELRLLEVLRDLDRGVPATVVPTFLGAHAVPPEYEEDAEGYVDLVVRRMLPATADRGLARFCDVFVEDGFFTPEQGRRILRAGMDRGLPAKVHADELTASGGTALAAEVGATSADHLLRSPPADLRALADAGTVAIALPGTSFASLDLPYCDARQLVDLNLPVALGTDLSPNAWVESMPLILSLACYRLRLRPEEAVTAATVNAAWAVGLGEEVGTLEPGKRGDLQVLAVRDYRDLPYRVGLPLAAYVVKDGAVVARDGQLTPRGEPG